MTTRTLTLERGSPATTVAGCARPCATTQMALLDYRKLCPRSGHVLTREERDPLGTVSLTRHPLPTVRCESCGRSVELVVHPGTGRSLIYPMHVKDCTIDCAVATGRPPSP